MFCSNSGFVGNRGKMLEEWRVFTHAIYKMLLSTATILNCIKVAELKWLSVNFEICGDLKFYPWFMSIKMNFVTTKI